MKGKSNNGNGNNDHQVPRHVCAVCHRAMGSGQSDVIKLENGQKAEIPCLISEIYYKLAVPAMKEIPGTTFRPSGLANSPGDFLRSVTETIKLKAPAATHLLDKASALSSQYGLQL